MEIKLEKEADYKEVEYLTREAFWNVYKPGCNEHFILHNLRKSHNFIKELDYVVMEHGKIVANIVYSIAYITNEKGEKKEVISFGPLSVHPKYQKMGIGKNLVEFTLKKAKELSYKAVLITGNPHYYSKFGFKPASSYDIFLQGIPKSEETPFFMALELEPDFFTHCNGICQFDCCFSPSVKDFEDFETNFPVKEKREARDTDL